MNKIIIANWKMNPNTLAKAIRLAKASDEKGVVIAPPFVFLETVGKIIRRASLAAQDVFYEESGAFTGGVSPKMLKGLGVEYVIIGHSERRNHFGETDETINKKVKAALSHGLKVILCVGEQWAVRKKGIQAAKNFVANQLRKDLQSVTKNYKLKAKSLIIAYEPVWAIGTGRNDKPENSSEMAEFIKRQVTRNKRQDMRVLYGGSVNSRNAKLFLEMPNIDGLLVGGASLDPREFSKIIRLIYK